MSRTDSRSPSHITTDCGDYTPASLEGNYADDLADFASLFPSVPGPTTNRTHCIIWSDYDTQPQVSLANGIRLDTNYYYCPGAWVQNRPGFMTGSGMPMRFAKANGTMIDVYQAATQMTDESEQTLPVHHRYVAGSRASARKGITASSRPTCTPTGRHMPDRKRSSHRHSARSVPVISAKQLLTWVDGRNGSSFGEHLMERHDAWASRSLSAAGANGLEGMIPAFVRHEERCSA